MFPFIYCIFWGADGSDDDEDEEEEEEGEEEDKFVGGEGGVTSVGEVGTTFNYCSREMRQAEESWMVQLTEVEKSIRRRKKNPEKTISAPPT